MKIYFDPFTSELLTTHIDYFQVSGRSVYFDQRLHWLTDRSLNLSSYSTVVNFSTVLLLILEANTK